MLVRLHSSHFIPGMPHNFGHRRSRSGSYFSGFTTRLAAQLQGQPTSKARSTEKLSELQLDSHSRAHSLRDICKESTEGESFEAYKVRIEEELELQVQSLLLSDKNKHYKEVTIPTSIKFSISREAVMARPRSPTSSRDTDFLDQTILSIRKKLVSCMH